MFKGNNVQNAILVILYFDTPERVLQIAICWEPFFIQNEVQKSSEQNAHLKSKLEMIYGFPTFQLAYNGYIMILYNEKYFKNRFDILVLSIVFTFIRDKFYI